MNRFLFPLLDRPPAAGGGGGSFPLLGEPPRYPDGRLRFVVPTEQHRPFHPRLTTQKDAYLVFVHHNYRIRRTRPQLYEWPPQPRPKPVEQKQAGFLRRFLQPLLQPLGA